MELIESIRNPKVSLWFRLKSKRGREQQGQYLIEGYKLLEEAIRSNQNIEVIIINCDRDLPDKLSDLIFRRNLKTITVSDTVFNKLAETESPQGVIAVAKKKLWTFNEIIKETDNFLLLIDEIQDPGNLGTIIRSADAAGIGGIIISKNTVELYNPKVIRSAMGSIFHLPILIDDLDDSIEKLKSQKIKIIGTSPYANEDYYSIDLINNIAIIIGNEARGLSEKRQRSTDQMVKIPITGNAESLNVAMATTIILFEHLRQKKFSSEIN